MSASRNIHRSIVYGPVKSRRFGLSLGINISGSGKYCSFNCLYCFRGFNDGRPDNDKFLKNIPSCGRVISELKFWLTKNSVEEIEDWTIAGNAEPTDNPDFPQIVDHLIALRNKKYPHVKITVLTNGMGLIPRLNPNHKNVRTALEYVDCACLKLDAGIPDTWRKLANPFRGVTLPEWLVAAEKLNSPVIQTMLVQGRIDNTTQDELFALQNCYQRLSPEKIYILTINKQPADSKLRPVSLEQLEQLRLILGDKTVYKNKV